MQTMLASSNRSFSRAAAKVEKRTRQARRREEVKDTRFVQGPDYEIVSAENYRGR